MMKLVVVGTIIAGGLAVGVYRAKLGAQQTDARISEIKSEIVQVEEEISVLEAEEAYLSRPERIGPLATEKLGLGPPQPEQFVATEMLSRRVGEERYLKPQED